MSNWLAAGPDTCGFWWWCEESLRHGEGNWWVTGLETHRFQQWHEDGPGLGEGDWQVMDWRHVALDDDMKMALGWGKAIVGWQEWDTWLWMTMWRWPQAGGGNEWLVDRHWWPMFQVDSIWHSFSFFRWKGSSLASDPLIIGTLTVTCLGCPFVWCTVVPQSLVNEFFYGPRTLELNKFMELFLNLENFMLVNSWVTLWTNLINNKHRLICTLVQ